MLNVKIKFLFRFSLLIFFIFIMTGCTNSEPTKQIAPHAHSGVLDLSNWNFEANGQVSLEGEWKFVWNELLSPEKMANSKDAHFVSVPDKWSHYIIAEKKLEHKGYGTFSLTLILPQQDQYYGFSFDGVGSAYSLWMDGALLMKSGVVATSKENMVPEKIPQSVFFKSTGEPIELVIQISNFQHKKGGFRNSLCLGFPEQIQNTHHKALILEAFSLGILFIMGLYHLSVYFFRKKFKSALYFAILCFLFLVRLGITNQDLFLLTFPSLSWTFAFYLEYITLFFIPLLISLFYRSLYPQEIPHWFIKLLYIISFSFSLFIIFSGTYIASFTTKYYQILIFMEIAYYLYFLFLINVRKREGALVITIASVILFITSSIEIFSLWDWIISDKIGVYGFLAFILVQSILLSQRYSYSFLRVKSLTDELKETNQDLQQSEIRFRNFFENSIDVIFLADEESKIIDISPSCVAILGYSRDEILNKKVTEMFNNVTYRTLFEQLRTSGQPITDIETVLKHRDGRDIEALITLALRFDENGISAGIQGSIHDNTDKKRAEREQMRILELEQIALTDPLTKVYNRRFFSEFAKKECERAYRNSSAFSLVMLDIDFFKNINDEYGHLVGDEVLINLAHLCLGHIRSTDVFARFGGEEFVIFFPDADGDETKKRIEILREDIENTVIARKNDQEIRITVSFGISCWNPGQNTDFTELLNHADMALYEAKESGRNAVVLFNYEEWQLNNKNIVIKNVKKYWHDFIHSSSNNLKYANRKYDWFSFGSDADKLAKWVMDGTKTGTASLYQSYVNNDAEIPKEGNCSIVLNSKNIPVCIYEINKVEVLKFNAVTENMAKKEINESNALEKWRYVHTNYFSAEAQKMGKVFTTESLIVFESFTFIYKI